MKLGPQILGAACLALATTGQEGAFEQAWPVRPEGVVFVFPNAFETPLAFDRPGAEPIFNYALERHGLAHIDGAGALQLSHGTASAPRQDLALVEFLAGAFGLSLQVWLTPPAQPPDDERTILAHGPKSWSGVEGASGPNFELTQRGSTYVFRLRVGERIEQVTGASSSSVSQHLGLIYGGDRLALFIDGHEIAATPIGVATEGLARGLAAWESGPLLFGSGSPASEGWAGALEGFALHAIGLSPEEMIAEARAYARRVGGRRPAPVTRLLGKLVARSTVPTPADIAPYPEAMAVYEYEVLRVREGFYLPKKMRVAHWVVLGETSLARARLALGDEVELTAIDFARNPQLENVNLSDSLPFDFDLRLFFEVTPPLAVRGK